jgi:hypothetical protein
MERVALTAIERMPPWQAAMANDTIRSTFVSTLLGQVRKAAAGVG